MLEKENQHTGLDMYQVLKAIRTIAAASAAEEPSGRSPTTARITIPEMATRKHT
jgi:hypothetical protein